MQPFLYQVAEDLKKQFGDSIFKTAIVFNNKRPMVFLKKYLSEVYGKTIVCPAMFPILDFMTLSTTKAVAHDLSRFFLLLDCYNQLLSEEGKEPVSSDFFYPMSRTILSDFDQIDYAKANPDKIYTHLKDLGELKQHFSDFTKEQQKFIENFWASFSPERQSDIQQKFIELWKRLPKLYLCFKEKLLSLNLTSSAMLYRDLADEKVENKDFIKQFQKVAFVGFNALNKCEAALFQKWQNDGNALFYFDGDDYYFKDSLQESGMFLRKNINDYRLKNVFGNFPNQLNNSNKQLFVYPVSGNAAQAKALPFHLPKNNANDLKRPNKIAVILADENLLIPALQSISDDSVINITMGFSVRQSSVFQLVQEWISIQQQVQSSKQLRLSETNLKRLFALNLLPFQKNETEEILNRYQQLSQIDFLLFLQKFNPLSQLLFTKKESVVDCIDSLKALLRLVLSQKESENNLKQLESGLLVSLFQELTKLQDLLVTFQTEMSIELILNLILQLLSGLKVPLEGTPLEGIQIMGMLESRCLDFDEIYILGANEDVLPHSSSANTFIPDSLRRAFGLPVKEYQEALSAYLFYRLCQRSKKIHIFYNDSADNNCSGEVTRFVRQLAFESNLQFQEKPQMPFRKGIGLNHPALKIEKSEPVLAKLNLYLTPNKNSFSASALKKYIECPLQFFMQHLAGIKEPETDKNPFDAAVMGTAFHQIMRQFYSEFEGKEFPVTKMMIQKQLPSLREICKKAINESLKRGAQSLVQDSQIVIAENILLENANIILNHDAEKIAPFKIISLEKDCSLSLPLDIYGNGHAEIVNFKGVIDRVDEVNGQLRIVDYKTGGDSTLIKNGLDSLFSHQTKSGNPAAFQVLFYTLLYYKKFGKVVQPNLYIIRKIAQEETALQLKIDKKNIVELDASLLAEFETNLAALIGELFHPEIIFQHNKDSKYCENSPYALFCNPEGQIEEEDE